MMRRFVVVAAICAAAVPAAANADAGDPVLGSPDYIPGTTDSGFGTVAPAMFHNGGAPSGLVADITWSDWGAPTALGRGTAHIYRPGGNYYPGVPARLRVKDIGTCDGRPEPAYLTLEIRVPSWPGGPLNAWKKWSESRTMCGYGETDPAYEWPSLPPGSCKALGEYGEIGTVNTIEVVRLSCTKARKAARRVRARSRRGGMWALRCSQRGCLVRAAGLRCKLSAIREIDGLVGYPALNPVQRLACRKGRRTLTAFLVVTPELTYWD